MKRTLLLTAALVGLALFLWLAVSASRPLLAWQWWMIPSSNPQSAPAACEAAGLLNQHGASRLNLFDSASYAAETAARDIQAALTAAYPDIQPVMFSELVRANVAYNGSAYQWLQTVQLTRSVLAGEPGVNQPGMAAIVLAGEGAEPQIIATAGAGIPELSCAFVWRDWAVDTARSLPFLLFAGYVVLGIGAGLGYALYRIVRRRRKAAPT